MLLLLPTLVLIASISAEDPVKQDCPKLKEVENGKITVVDGVAKLKCVGKNFKAKAPKKLECKDGSWTPAEFGGCVKQKIHTLLCKNGKWKPSWKTVTCVGTPEKKPKKVTCKARRAPVGGRVDFSTRRMPGNRVAVNTIATITCKDTNETHTLHCKDGKWKPRWKKVTCKPKKEKPEGPVDEPMPLPA
ncbi:hypothetical protein Q1695_007231 [Nippostrongylus brasiliensis]|nr:hypothetical protein Q1695_007231 [Nippostrongylus brasiliensis]